MRIAFVTPEYVTEQASFDGGLANYVHRVCLALVELGHEPVVIVWSDRDEDFIHAGIRISRVKVDLQSWQLRLMKWWHGGKHDNAMEWLWIGHKLNQRLSKLHAQKALDITQYSSYMATGYYRLNSIPAVNRISSYEPLLRQARGITQPTPDHLFMEQLEKEALRKSDGVFGPSKLIGAAVAKDIGKHVEIIETPFVLDTKELDSSVYEKYLQDKKYLLYWGSLSRVKGTDIIADMLHEFLDKYPDKYFVFIGKDTTGTMVQLLKDKAGEYAHRLIFLTQMPHTQLYPIINQAELVVLPSRIDNFPNTCLESMAFHKVTIGTWGTSFEQLIDDEVSGLLCKSGDPIDLLLTIEKGLNLSASQKQAMGEKAAQRIESLRPEKVGTQLIRYYSSFIDIIRS